MPYVVTESCIGVLDRSCISVCPVDCIYEGGSMMYIHADECVDCGACEPACPTAAIYYEDDLPNTLKEFQDAAASFFTLIGTPGGAKKVGKLPHDAGPAAQRVV